MQKNINIISVELANTKERSVYLAISDRQVRVMRKSTLDINKDLKIYGNAVINNIGYGVTLDITDGNLSVQGNIQDSVTINIKNGSIIVDGFIGNNVNINIICGRIKVIKGAGKNLKIKQKTRVISKNTYRFCFFGSITYKKVSTLRENGIFGIQFLGNIGNNCKINTDSTLYCKDKIGDQCYIKAKRNIVIKELGVGSYVTSDYGPISISAMKSSSSAITACKNKEYGKIKVDQVETYCLLKSQNCNLSIKMLG